MTAAGTGVAGGVITDVGEDIVIPQIQDSILPDEKKPFPWLLVAAAGLGVTKTVPVAVAAGIGALGLLLMNKDK